MKEKLIIKNFGPIKDVELELGRFNILIGEQATGKSTVAKMLAVCRYFSYVIDQYNIFGKGFENGLIAQGLDEFIHRDSFIAYHWKHYSFTAQRNHTTVQDHDQSGEVYERGVDFFETTLVPHSDEFKSLLDELERIKPKANENYIDFEFFDWTIPTSFFQNDVAAVIDNPFYIPAERGLQSIFSLGKSSIQNLSDTLFNALAKLDEIARKFTSETLIEPVDVFYKNVNGRGYVRKKSEAEFYSLFNAATGYQSIIPIVLSINYYNRIKKKGKTFIIEEPELSLFPDAQNRLINFLVDAVMNNGNSVLLTTHSPYILTSPNNLLYAFKVGRNHEEETRKIIEKKYWLNAREFSIYKLSSDGTCEDIFDQVEEMIKVEEIDRVSERLNAGFEKLMNIEFVENEPDPRTLL